MWYFYSSNAMTTQLSRYVEKYGEVVLEGYQVK